MRQVSGCGSLANRALGLRAAIGRINTRKRGSHVEKGFVEVADDFPANKTWNNWMINHVFLVGGWNLKDDITEEFIVPFITEFDTRVNEI